MWGGKVIKLAKDVVKLILSPTVIIKEDWMEPQYQNIVNEIDATVALLGLDMESTKIEYDTQATKKMWISKVSISPL